MSQIDFWTHEFLRRRGPVKISGFLFSPFYALASTWRQVGLRGSSVREDYGIPLYVQVLEIWLLQLHLPLTFLFSARLYYTNHLFMPERRSDGPFVFSDVHQNTLTMAVNGAHDHMDKSEFARVCERAQLPHIPTVAEIGTDGVVTWCAGLSGLPPEDLFTKPARGANGWSASRFLWQPSGRYRSEPGKLLDHEAILDLLRSVASRGPILIQVMFRNHPRIEELFGATVATIRYVSLLLPDGRVEVVLAVHRSACRDSPVDNVATGGVVCGVDLETGTLKRPTMLYGMGVSASDRHPRTGRRITGVRLPYWAEIVELIRRAHRVFDRYPALGWDVAIGPTGPVLVEANAIWVAGGLQAANGVALGRLPYARHLLEQLERRVREGEDASFQSSSEA